MSAHILTIREKKPMITKQDNRIYALVTRQGTACDETALCAEHFTPENRAKALQAGMQNRVDPPFEAAGWQDCSDNDALACIICGRHGCNLR